MNIAYNLICHCDDMSDMFILLLITLATGRQGSVYSCILLIIKKLYFFFKILLFRQKWQTAQHLIRQLSKIVGKCLIVITGSELGMLAWPNKT